MTEKSINLWTRLPHNEGKSGSDRDEKTLVRLFSVLPFLDGLQFKFAGVTLGTEKAFTFASILMYLIHLLSSFGQTTS